MEQWELAIDTINERMAEASADSTEGQIKRISEADGKSMWRGDEMGERPSTTGLRVALQNFQHQLYATDEAITQTALSIKKMQIDIMIGLEPGKGDEERIMRLQNAVLEDELGSQLITESRNPTKLGGGIIIWMTHKWASVQRKVETMRTEEEELNGRLMAVTFDNGEQGHHNKLLLLVAHGICSAHKNKRQAQEIYQWIADKKDKFSEKYPRATVILAGDLNAAKYTDLDTDRKGPQTLDAMEPDAFVIQDLEGLQFTDVYRHHHPDTQVVTRREPHHTNRFLDRIMATKEAATHMATAIAVYKDDIHGGNSDHLLVLADFPIDTAGAAEHSTEMWEKHTSTTWSLDEDSLGKIDEAKTVAMNSKLEASHPKSQEAEHILDYYLEAAKGTMLQERTRTFPKPILKRKHFSSNDHKIRSNLRHLRHAVLKVSWDEDMGQVRMLTRLLIEVPGTIHDPQTIRNIQSACRKKKTALEKLSIAVKTAEQHLKREKRKARDKEIRERVSTRNQRFDDPKKKKMKQVITSIMRKMAKRETITESNDPDKGKVTTEAAVGKAVTKFYRSWMKSRTAPEERWTSKEAMLNMDPAGIKDKAYEDLIKTTYLPSFNKYTHLQQTQGIWDSCTGEIAMQDLIKAIKSMKAGTAPGVSGIGYEILKAINPDHLQPLLNLLNKITETGETPDIINRTLLKPLPKTDKGLSDLNLTRPISLMETTLKIYERIIYTRIMKVLKGHDMLHTAQYGSLPERAVGTPVRVATEIIEDAIMSGQELHLFSADIKKAFDSCEYWSQAMSWRALGMPEQLIDLLTGMDIGGSTEVAIGHGRTTATRIAKMSKTQDIIDKAAKLREMDTPTRAKHLSNIDPDTAAAILNAIPTTEAKEALALLSPDTEGELTDRIGRYANGRGVRQGSIGGPIKWVVFMNFWLEYIHTKMKGKGYMMNHDQSTEMLGQMFVDDSTWTTNSVDHMKEMISHCEKFVDFHALEFNKKKSEYAAVNQRSHNQEGLPEYQRPTWSNGDELHETMRKHELPKQWRAHAKEMRREASAQRYKVLAIEGETPAEQPAKKAYNEINESLKEWTAERRKDWQQQGQGTSWGTHPTRTQAISVINRIKISLYPHVSESHREQSTHDWIEEWESTTNHMIRNDEGKERAIRYLGVHFSLELPDTHSQSMGWKVQRKILDDKFKDLHKKITRSNPTRAQAIYCINACINSTLKYTLQVAAIPDSDMDKWDTAHREIVRAAGKLPSISPYMMHAPKNEGGLGLESIKASVQAKLISDQITFLNQDTMVGTVVRAAHARHLHTPDKNQSMQKRIQETLDKFSLMVTQESTTQGNLFTTKVVSNYKAIDHQSELDLKTAQSNDRLGGEWEAYGDGATWEGVKAGWGMYLVNRGTSPVTEIWDKGKTSGDQKNESAEAQAILRILLRIHPSDPVTIYCDNDECVRKWENIQATRDQHNLLQWHNRATWLRIQQIHWARDDTSTKTNVRWIRSHIDDEANRTSASKHRVCACRTNPDKDECAEPGDPTFFMHQGNEEADEQAKEGADLPQNNDVDETAKGEVEYILRSGQNVAQGPYRKWTTAWIQSTERRPTQEGHQPKGADRWREATPHANTKMRSAMLKMLDSKGKPSWRFWVRLMLSTLPTMSQMAKFSLSKQSAYAAVYQPSIGPEGRCTQPGCSCPKETTVHATIECAYAKEAWQRTDHRIDSMWMEEGADWARLGWINNPPLGWKPQWTTWGLVPDTVARVAGGDRATMARLKRTVNMIIDTSLDIWNNRNTYHLEWEATQEGMVDRKKAAKFSNWSPTPMIGPLPKPVAKPRTETQKIEDSITRAKLIRREEITRAETVKQAANSKWQQSVVGISKPEEEDAESIERRVTKSMRTEVRALHEPRRKRECAQGTRKLTGAETTASTTPPHNAPRPMKAPCSPGEHWIPTVGTRVKVAWTLEGGGLKIGGQRGHWRRGKVTKLEWPQDKGTPGVRIKYDDRSTHWHGLNLAGSVLMPQDIPKPNCSKSNPRKRQQKKHTLPAEALQWIGQGAVIKVKWPSDRGSEWWEGEVIGREQAGIIVRYQGGVARKEKGGERTVAAHTNLRQCGCIIKAFARWTTDEAYQSASARRGCPYRGEEADCECHHCATVTWPERCSEAALGASDTAAVLGATPADREAAWTRATSTQPQAPPTNTTVTTRQNTRPKRKPCEAPQGASDTVAESQSPQRPKRGPQRNVYNLQLTSQPVPHQNGKSARPTTPHDPGKTSKENGEPERAAPNGPSDRRAHQGPKDRRSDVRRPTQGNQVKSPARHHRGPQSRQNLGVGRPQLLEQRGASPASPQRPVPTVAARRRTPGAQGKGEVGLGADPRGESPSRQGRSHREGECVAIRVRSPGKRGSPSDAETRETATTEGSGTEPDGVQRGSSCDHGRSCHPHFSRCANPHRDSEPPEQTGPMDSVVRGRVDMDRGEQVVGPLGLSSTIPRPTSPSKVRPPGAGPRRGVGVSREGHQGHGQEHQSGRSGQQGVHRHGIETRNHHGRNNPRLCSQQLHRPHHSNQQEGGSPHGGMDAHLDEHGVQVVLQGECNEPSDGNGTWALGAHSAQQGKLIPSQASRGEETHEGSHDGDPPPTGGPGSPPRADLRLGATRRLGPVGPASGQAAPEEEPLLDQALGRPVRLRPRGPEAHSNSDELRVDPKGHDRPRQMLSRQVCRDQGQPARRQTALEADDSLRGKSIHGEHRQDQEKRDHQGDRDKLGSGLPSAGSNAGNPGPPPKQRHRASLPRPQHPLPAQQPPTPPLPQCPLPTATADSAPHIPPPPPQNPACPSQAPNKNSHCAHSRAYPHPQPNNTVRTNRATRPRPQQTPATPR
jgi:hypothetical protein